MKYKDNNRIKTDAGSCAVPLSAKSSAGAAYAERYEGKMINPFQKLKDWYRGKHIPYTLQGMIDLQQPRYLERHEQKFPERYGPPSLLKRIVDLLIQFWFRHWQWIIGIIIAIGMLFVAILNLISPKHP